MVVHVQNFGAFDPVLAICHLNLRKRRKVSKRPILSCRSEFSYSTKQMCIKLCITYASPAHQKPSLIFEKPVGMMTGSHQRSELYLRNIVIRLSWYNLTLFCSQSNRQFCFTDCILQMFLDLISFVNGFLSFSFFVHSLLSRWCLEYSLAFKYWVLIHE